MCSAGLLNGTRICEDTALLTDTLRGAWGFAGAVLAEPGAVQDPARRWPRVWTLPLRTRDVLWMPCSPARWTSPF